MFTEFYYYLKDFGVPVSFNEWQDLMNALDQGMAGSSLTGFYYLGRALLVKSEAHYDRFDLAFASYFQDADWRVKLEGSLAKAAPLLTARVPALEVSMAQCARISIESGGV